MIFLILMQARLLMIFDDCTFIGQQHANTRLLWTILKICMILYDYSIFFRNREFKVLCTGFELEDAPEPRWTKP